MVGIKVELDMGKPWHIVDVQGILFFSIPSLSAWKLSFPCKKGVVHMSKDHQREGISQTYFRQP